MDTLRALAVAALLFAPAVRAAEPSREATAAQNQGLRAYDEGRYRDALDKFQLSYTLAPQPALLLAIARSAYRLKDTDRAKACLFDFLRDDPKSLSASEAFELLTKIEKESPATARAASARCVQPETLKKPVAEAPKPAVEKKATPPEWTSPHPAPAAAVPTTSVTTTAQPRQHGPWSYVAAGGAVAAAGVATYFGTRNLSATSDWRNATDAATAAGARDRARSAATNANVAWAAAGALACTAAGLYLFTEF